MSQGTFIVPAGSWGRADKVLARAFPEHSRSAWQRAFAAGLVRRRNVLRGEGAGGEAALGQKDSVRVGEEIAFSFPDVVPSELKPKAIPLDVLFEDRHLLVVNKAAGMVVHPGAATADDTLVHALLAHCAGKLSGIGGVERPGIVHRLDRDTSGAIVVAKTDAAHRGLAAQFAERRVQKEYLALVAGVPHLLSGSIRKPIGRNPHHRHKMAAFEPVQESFGEDEVDAEPGPHRREAHTDWSLVERYGDRAALIRCVLHTGRTHQIRVHLKSIGHVLLGDAVYGFKPGPPLPAIPRLMLHAERLAFEHPVSGKKIDLRAPLPADFDAVEKRLRRKVAALK